MSPTVKVFPAASTADTLPATWKSSGIPWPPSTRTTPARITPAASATPRTSTRSPIRRSAIAIAWSRLTMRAFEASTFWPSTVRFVPSTASSVPTRARPPGASPGPGSGRTSTRCAATVPSACSVPSTSTS
ncbi:MAG: hypothetical protein QM704_26885 [Anaeromyxobacteraceae bacterium]